MSDNGSIAKHAVVTDTCRANRTDEGAAREAADRLIAEFLECAPAWKDKGAEFHFILTIKRPARSTTPGETPEMRKVFRFALWENVLFAFVFGPRCFGLAGRGVL